MAWYRTGSITVTNGSVTVSGAGTSWISNAAIGEALYAPDGRLYEIVNIASDTTITLQSAYLGATASAQAYVIVPSQSYIRDLAAQAADLVNNYSTIYNTVGQGKFGDGTLAAPGIRFSDDLDTGFFRSASNEVTFVAGGTAIFKYNLTGGLSLTSGGDLVGTTATQTLTNKTLTSPTITGTGTAAFGNLSYTGTLTGGTGVINIGSGQVYKDASGNVAFGTTTTTASRFAVVDPVGSATSISFLGSPDNQTSNWRHQLDHSGFSGRLRLRDGNNTETIRLNSAGDSYFTGGNVQIGTTTARGKLHSSSSTFNPLNSTWATTASFTASGGFSGGLAFVDGSSGYGVWVQDSGGSFVIGQGGTGGGLTERMRLDASGNLGLGVTPSAWGASRSAFDLGSNGYVASQGTQLGLLQNAFFNGTNWIYKTTAAASRQLLFNGEFTWSVAPSGTAGNAISFTQVMTLDASGNLAIGATSSEGYKALITGSGIPSASQTSNLLTLRAGASSFLNFIAANEGGVAYQRIVSTDGLQFWTSSTERARIDSSGNLLVGTTTNGPNIFSTGAPKVTINAVLSVSNGTTSVNLGSVSSNEGLFFNSTALRVYNGSGTGVFLNSGATSWSASSDERLKTRLVPFENALGKVCTIRAGTGRYLADTENVSRSFLIAQDIQAVLPEAVDVMDDELGTLGLRYTDTIPLLVAAIQELKAEFDAYKAAHP